LRLIRVHVEAPLAAGGRVTFEGPAAAHVRRVLRLEAGDPLTLFNGDGHDYPSRIAGFGRGTVEAEIQNVDGLLKPGQFATVRITQSKPEPAVMVPVVALKTVGNTTSVFVIKDGQAREQFVQVGLLENDMIQIKSGVVEGDLVATSNVNQLVDGTLVRQ
jgi:hypothetical protein